MTNYDEFEIYRSSHSQMFFKIGVLKIFANLAGKHQCRSQSLFNKVAGLQGFNFIKKRLVPIQVFSWEICESFKDTFF